MFRHRTLLLVGVLMLAAAGAATLLWTRSGADRTTSVDVAKVARDARAKSPRTAQDPGLRPEPGTYRYRVEGFDRVSALGGSKHEFGPEIAAIVELRRGCEWTIEFLYAEERRVKSTYCTTENGTRMLETTNTVEFFGVGQADRQRCDGAALVVPAPAKVGAQQKFTCKNDDRSVAHVASVLAPTNAPEVDGVDAAELVLVRDQLTVTGETTGSTTTKTWSLPSGLPVAFTEKSMTRSKSVLGDTDYEIDSTVELVSATPE